MCTCAQLYSLAETTHPPPHRIWAHIWGRLWSAKIDDISLWPYVSVELERKKKISYLACFCHTFFSVFTCRSKKKVEANISWFFLEHLSLISNMEVFKKTKSSYSHLNSILCSNLISVYYFKLWNVPSKS